MKIEVKNVSKSFKNIDVLTNIDITFEGGHIYGLIGRNGSGKSVFLKMLCGFYEPTIGDILYDGESIVKSGIYPPNTRAIIEKPTFLSDLSGYDNLLLLANIQNKIGKEEIEKTMEKVNILEEKNKKYSKYSMGTKQKLGIAQVLMEDPEVMIFDEPFNGIENETAEKLRKVLLEEKEKGKLIILASHIKEDIIELADVVYEVNSGKIEKK